MPGTELRSDGDTRPAWVVTSGEVAPATVERLLLSLPDWFGIPASNAAYVAAARELPTYLARAAGNAGRDADPAPEPVGVLLARRHFQHSAEIHLMAVDPHLHRRGVGRALVATLEADLISDGCQLLQVKTLGPSRPDAGYALTRMFYTSLGFMPLEELADLWGPQNPCLVMVKALGQAHRAAGSAPGKGPGPIYSSWHKAPSVPRSPCHAILQPRQRQGDVGEFPARNHGSGRPRPVRRQRRDSVRADHIGVEACA